VCQFIKDIERGHLDDVRSILEKDHSHHIIHVNNSEGASPLHVAVIYRRHAIAELLLKKCVNVNAVDSVSLVSG
jgi:ankyrin repeat protein